MAELALRSRRFGAYTLQAAISANVSSCCRFRLGLIRLLIDSIECDAHPVHLLDTVRNAVTLRMKNNEVEVTDGPYAETKETLGGILLLEARDLNHAIALMSKHPGVKMGPFEIRPPNEAINQLVAERNAAITKRS